MRRALRGRLLDFSGDPSARADAMRYVEDGVLVVAGGRVEAAGEAAALLPGLGADVPVVDHRPHLILPGFIDAHLHFPQTQVVASYGAQLMDWLHAYTFVEEQRFADPAHAERGARFLLDELARQGTTTGVFYGSVHEGAADALFAEAERRRLRLIAGKVMMDRNAPPALTDTAQSGYDASKRLIARWHGRGRLGYAIAPRFAVTSSPAQLEAAGALAREHPDCHVETHISENPREIDAARALYPERRDYLDIYDHYGLLGPRTLLGHCLHLSGRERARLVESGSVAVFCPTSNLFLGSGLFDRAGLKAEGARIALATDIGGGTSYSMLATMAEAYKVLQLRGESWPAAQAFYEATAGNAAALGLEGRIGSLAPGAEADLVVLDSRATPAMAFRAERVATLEEELFVLMTMGDDRAVRATYVLGEAAFVR